VTGSAPQLLKTSEAARAVNIHPKTLSTYVADGKVRPTLRLPGGHMRWDLDDLKAQLRRLYDDEQPNE
jgi:DNA-binding transcriptional MerR regulator